MTVRKNTREYPHFEDEMPAGRICPHVVAPLPECFCQTLTARNIRYAATFCLGGNFMCCIHYRCHLAKTPLRTTGTDLNYAVAPPA